LSALVTHIPCAQAASPAGALHQLTSFAIGAGDADWASDGRKIVFEACPSASSTGNADVVPSGGGRVKQLTHDGSADPVWSPDGTKILFLHASTKNGEFFIGLATMKPDGSGIRYLTSTSAQQQSARLAVDPFLTFVSLTQ
jgi:Tol biopolymer transport system component